MAIDPSPPKNRLFRILAPKRPRFLTALERIELEKGQELERPGTPIDYVYFPENSLLSVLATAGSKKIEVGMIGYEGVTGTSIVLGADHPAHVVLVQSAGSALRLPVA